MKKIAYCDIFNVSNSKKANIILLIMGFVMTAVSTISYGYTYSKIDFVNWVNYKDELLLLFVFVSLIFLGIVMFIATLNLNSKTIRFILTLMLGMLTYSVVRERPFRLAFIILLSAIAFLVITKLLSKVFSTLITFSLSSFVIIFFMSIFCRFTPNMKVPICLYICISVFIALYNCFGTKLNHLCLKYVFGHSSVEISKFDYDALKNQINLLYLLLFVMLNIFFIFSEQVEISAIANSVNNALITGVCITNVNWKSLLWDYTQKKERKNNISIELLSICQEDMTDYKKNLQESLKMGADNGFPNVEVNILSESDIDRSLSTKGAVAYKAVKDGKIVGGAIVVIDKKSQHNHLDFLYVKSDVQNKGIGQAIWAEIEKLYPKTKVWETSISYFDKRNIHFYVNRCGFHAVEFYNEYQKKENSSDDNMDDRDEMFRFEKVMR